MTLIQKEPKKIYIGSTEVKKVYIGNTYVRPIIHATGISLNQSSISLTTAGQTYQLTATLTPADATDTVTWTSSNTSIATVSQSGLVTCVTPGSATITATANEHSATCSIVAVITVTDYTTSANYNSTINNPNAYFGVKFTALKSGSIKKVGFFNQQGGTLKIAQGNYASASGTTYTLSNATEYTLTTPYNIVAGQSYVVSVITSSSGYWYSASNSLPQTRTAVKYDYTTLSTSSSTYTNRIYMIKSLTIEYTP